MARKLVIVESPAKARTLGRILGPSFTIKASLGHVRDLPKKGLGVDIENSFAPEYVVPRRKQAVIREIKGAASQAGSIYLATDPDREGEAISWHLTQAAKLDSTKLTVRRVVFHEITTEAVQKAFKHPHSVNMNLVNAQQARRILDRLVGYRLSPLLWRKVQRGLSAGRVQSVAVRMIVDREQEIQGFVTEEYWTLMVELSPLGEHEKRFRARLVSLEDGTGLDIATESESDRIAADLEKAQYSVKSTKTKQMLRQPSPPFVTSTLQQEAWRRLHFTAKRTMAVAQQLYEGLALGEEGSVGLVTYIRTDSTRVAASAIAQVRQFIAGNYGQEFVPPKPRHFAKKTKWAQEAHEAIRPTEVSRVPQHVKQFLSSDQSRLYELIWKRMVASQMSSATYDATSVKIRARLAQQPGYLLEAASSILTFPGFLAVYAEAKDEDERREVVAPLPHLKESDSLAYWGTFPEQHFTQPPPRYTEATLVRDLEQKGIGRPSTYAPILSVIQERDYVRKGAGRFFPTDLGEIVNGILTQHFPQIVDLGFTARMEEQLDEVAQGQQEWVSLLRDFYQPFEDMLHKASLDVDKVDMTQPAGETCPNCGRPMVIKLGRFGKFVACSGYPECKTTKPFLVRTGVACPQCGSDLVEKVTKRKRLFYGCSNYPQCKFATSYRPISVPCPECGKLLVSYRRGLAKCVVCGYQVGRSGLESVEAERE